MFGNQFDITITIDSGLHSTHKGQPRVTLAEAICETGYTYMQASGIICNGKTYLSNSELRTLLDVQGHLLREQVEEVIAKYELNVRS